ncbi:glucokinase [Chitinophaga terrae (ex Kim and Jung 2007)]|uniref:ROK family protein n=1 Tax=Chitinophaga terrae (ex Kim and Jung 2007) TaxID=408074 RepID=UPI002785964D|nr:ROK family protein [Chitinophaga terrae (ex Kim and Jung 2007)]MDQ0109532.1 glucokinase [Chitinophaga terrae (ex Kim and Jung 2007)]
MIVGFDIGGTKCAVILGEEVSDSRLEIRDKIILPTDKPVYEMIDALYKHTELLLERNAVSLDAVQGIGISCGGPLSSRRGMILSPPNLPGWDNIPIVEMSVKKFNKPVLLQNDANACAMAEWKYGAGRGYENLVFLTFGTGMGAGLILNGKLYSGTTDLAGEVGHLRLSDMGPVGFGKAGSFEGWCSGGGIAQLAQIRVRQRLQMGEKVSFCSKLEDLPGLTAKMVAEAAYRGDATAIEIYRDCGTYLGKALALLIDILNPEVIVIGSIYGRAQSLLEPAMREVLEREAIRTSYEACRIMPASLSENIGDIAALSLAVQAAAM